MAKVEIAYLIGDPLDWAVAQVKGLQPIEDIDILRGHRILPHPYYEGYDYGFNPSTDAEQAYEIILSEGITVGPHTTSPFIAHYGPAVVTHPWEDRSVGPTPFVAAMRCFLEKKCPERWIEIPDELFTEDAPSSEHRERE